MHHTISTSIDLIENDINALMKQLTKKLKSNLTHNEYIVMEELAERSTKLQADTKTKNYFLKELQQV